jgi:hypothetical protein
MADTLDLPQASRYKDTPVFTGTRGPEFGLMESPVEAVQEDSAYRTHRVRSHEVGFLDLIAVRHYGMGTEPLWWFLALSNAIIDPEIDMFVGQELLIPPKRLVDQFRTRSSLRAS